MKRYKEMELYPNTPWNYAVLMELIAALHEVFEQSRFKKWKKKYPDVETFDEKKEAHEAVVRIRNYFKR